ncbi:scavenger receptor class B member 1-like [Stegodyphus dumicola]|uniref:scavenger receptor class B member 1-like n=1 Tax=Stegodyphus dumicola TaxID=202533 RepID=UPI0015ACB821|nr:scavenger receptor class B member 1-like [Stegodyphus dumicola]
MYDLVLSNMLKLSRTTSLFKIWKDGPLVLHQKLYFFNITNAAEFLAGAKMDVKEVGPFTYRLEWQRRNLRWNTGNTLSYTRFKLLHFVPELSVANEKATIYSLNIPLLTYSINDKNKKKEDNLHRYNQTLVTKITVDQFLHHILDDSSIEKAEMLSWISRLNGSISDNYTVFTGEATTDVNIVKKWDGKSELGFWKKEACNMINGSTIDLRPSFSGNGILTNYSFFEPELCRSLTLTQLETKISQGLYTNRFEISNRQFSNGSVYKPNSCFDSDHQFPSGVLDVSRCYHGAPVLLSLPHFYLADMSYFQQVSGLQPNITAHTSYVIVEPISGLTINFALRYQFNVKVRGPPNHTDFISTSKRIYPVLWVEVSGYSSEDSISFLFRFVKVPLFVMDSVVFKMCFFAVFTITAIFLLCFMQKRQEQEHFTNSIHRCVLDERSFLISDPVNTFSTFPDMATVEQITPDTSAVFTYVYY